MGIMDWISPSSMLGNFISKVFTGPLIQAGVDVYKTKIAKDNDVNHVLADVAAKEIALDQKQRELDAQIIVAEQGNWFTRYPRGIVQWTLALYIAKCILWDKVLGLGVTDPVNYPMIENAFNLIIVMWFGGRTLEKITSNVVNRIK